MPINLDTKYIPHSKKRYKIFFDESGYIGNFKIKNGELNNIPALYNDFILAGIATTKNTLIPEKIKILLKQMCNNKEIKFKNYVSNFTNKESIFWDENLSKLLKWLLSSSFYIHYSDTNHWYFTLTDIVDEALTSFNDVDFYYHMHFKIKDILYFCSLSKIKDLILCFNKFGYPRITKNKEFCSELFSIIKTSKEASKEFLEKFNEILIVHSNLYPKDYEYANASTGCLIDNYSFAYWNRIANFRNSVIVFDNQIEIKRKLQEIHLFYNMEEIKNYKFNDSSNNIFIQLSDFVSGFLKFTFSFLDLRNFYQIKHFKHLLYDKKINNFSTLAKLIDKSDYEDKILIVSFVPQCILDSRNSKIDWLRIEI